MTDGGNRCGRVHSVRLKESRSGLPLLLKEEETEDSGD